jgi:hypothetical protein
MFKRIVWLATVMLTACGAFVGTPDFTLTVSPEFVQGVIPGASSGVLATITNESPTDLVVAISAAATGADISVEPAEITEGMVAEVWVVAPDVTDETPFELTIDATRAGVTHSTSRTTSVFPWEDDRAEYAQTLLNLFTGWLEQHRPELGVTRSTQLSGSFVAPGLLVVSHYMFVGTEWEIGLSWHVMIAPDDWAEIYLRPRSALAPSLAFRLASQQAALDEGTIEIAEVAPPAEVVR